MSTTQIPDLVSVDNNVEVQTPNRALAPIGESAQIRGLHPNYQYQNPHAFRSNFVTDSKFRNQFVKDVFGLRVSQDPEYAAQIQENPERFLQRQREVENEMLESIYQEISTGEEIGDAIARRGADLSRQQFNPARIPDYARVVAAFPEHYEQFGITDGKKMVDVYRQDANLVGRMVQTDDELREQVYKDRFGLFVNTIGQDHNRQGVDFNDPTQIAKAFAVFENYGSEGLTQYVNYFQRYDPQTPLREQSPEVRRAHAFFNSPGFDGKDPREVVNNFVGGPNSPTGRLTFQPKELSMEVGSNVPTYLNNFSQYFESDSSLGTLLGAAKHRTFPSDEEGNRTGPNILHTPQQIEEFRSMLQEGTPTKKGKDMLFDIMTLARNNEGFGMEDLFASIANHAEFQPGERGAVEYVFNPDELPIHARAAYEALILDHSTGGSRAFRNAGDGMIAMEPARQERLQNLGSEIGGFRLVNMSRMPVHDESGNVVGYEDKYDPRLFSFDYPGLMIGRTGQFLNDYLVTPLIQATAKGFEVMGSEEMADKITSSDFFTALRETADFDPYAKTSGFFGGGGGALLLTDLSAYIGGSLAIGAAAAATGGTALAAVSARAAASANSLRTASLSGKFLGGAQMTRWQATGLKTKQVLDSPAASVYLRTELGAGSLEALGGTRRSMLANPFVDGILESVGVQSNIERTYAVSDNITRIGLDLLGSVGVGLVFDNALAGIKYGGNVFRTSRGKSARGLEFNFDTNDFNKVNHAVFAPEYRRMWHNITNGLQEMPLGTAAETQANLFLGRSILRNPENINSFEDVLGTLNHEMGDLFNGLRGEIEVAVRHWDETFGGTMRYSDDQLADRVDRLYYEFMDKLSDGVTEIFREVDPAKRDIVGLMADRMANQASSVRQVGLPTSDGIRMTMNQIEANTLANHTPNSVVREVVQPDGSVAYTVHRVDQNFWGVELANRLKQRHSRVTVDDVAERNVRRMGIDVDDVTPEQVRTQREIRHKAENVVGKQVIYDNQRGYITDFDPRNPNSYTVRTVDGVEHRNAEIFEGMVYPERIELEGSNAIQDIQARGAMLREQTGTPTIPGTVRMLPQEAGPSGRVGPEMEVRQDLRAVLDELDLKTVREDIEDGLPSTSIMGRMRDAGVPEAEVRRSVSAKIGERISEVQNRIVKIRDDKRIKRPETRQNRIQEQENRLAELRDTQAEFDRALTEAYGGDTRALADDAIGQSVDVPVQRLATRFREGEVQTRKMKNDARLISGRGTRGVEPTRGSFRDTFGVGQRFFNKIINTTQGSISASIASVRKVVMALGSDNNLVDNVRKIAYNKGSIKPIKAGTEIKKNTAVIHNGDVYIARKRIPASDVNGVGAPSVWIPDTQYGAVMNPYWARVGKNVTADPVTGELKTFVREGHGSHGPIYREANADDPFTEQVYLNIQQAVENRPRINNMIDNNIDAIRSYEGGVRKFEIINNADQAIAINKVHQFEPSAIRASDINSIGIC